MTLYKATPEGNIEMSSLEEAVIKAGWAVGEARSLVPSKPDADQQLEWLNTLGLPYMQQKMIDWKKSYEDQMLKVKALEDAEKKANKKFINSLK
jgi:hypothetical protein